MNAYWEDDLNYKAVSVTIEEVTPTIMILNSTKVSHDTTFREENVSQLNKGDTVVLDIYGDWRVLMAMNMGSSAGTLTLTFKEGIASLLTVGGAIALTLTIFN